MPTLTLQAPANAPAGVPVLVIAMLSGAPANAALTFTFTHSVGPGAPAGPDSHVPTQADALGNAVAGLNTPPFAAGQHGLFCFATTPATGFLAGAAVAMACP